MVVLLLLPEGTTEVYLAELPNEEEEEEEEEEEKDAADEDEAYLLSLPLVREVGSWPSADLLLEKEEEEEAPEASTDPTHRHVARPRDRHADVHVLQKRRGRREKTKRVRKTRGTQKQDITQS